MEADAASAAPPALLPNSEDAQSSDTEFAALPSRLRSAAKMASSAGIGLDPSAAAVSNA